MSQEKNSVFDNCSNEPLTKQFLPFLKIYRILGRCPLHFTHEIPKTFIGYHFKAVRSLPFGLSLLSLSFFVGLLIIALLQYGMWKSRFFTGSL